MSLDLERSSSEWVNIGNNLLTTQNVPGVTICGWAIPESTSSFGSAHSFIASSIGTSTTSSRVLIFQSVASPSLWSCGGRRLDTDGFSALFDNAVSVANLVHVGAVFDFANSSLVFYENGVSVASSSPGWGGNTSNTAGQRTALGANDDGGSEYYDGRIQDLRMYNRALSAGEMGTIYAARGHDNLLYGLIHRWKLMELSPGTSASLANSIRDACIGERHGSPNNTPTYREALVSVRRRRRAA
jgi:hypothetical protein